MNLSDDGRVSRSRGERRLTAAAAAAAAAATGC